MGIIEIGGAIFGILFIGYALYNTGRNERAKIAEETAFSNWVNRSPRPEPLAVAYVEHCVRYGGYHTWEQAAWVADHIDWHRGPQEQTDLFQIHIPNFAPAMLQITIPNFIPATRAAEAARRSLPHSHTNDTKGTPA